jgi:hypothetical protein
MRAGEHYPDKHRTYVSVAFQNPTANQTERDRGRMLVRQAAWRFYGMTGGTHVVTGFDWRPDCSNDIDRVTICIRNRPATDGCAENTGHASWPGFLGGRMHICTDPRDPLPLPEIRWLRGRSAVLAHEMVHAFVEIGDEYWESDFVSRICDTQGVRILRCLHSTMSFTWHEGQLNTLCTPATHNAVVEYREQDRFGPGTGFQTFRLIRGPNTITECANGSTTSNGPHQNASWEHMWTTGRVPYPHPSYTPDNYSFELFGNTPDITSLGGHAN